MNIVSVAVLVVVGLLVLAVVLYGLVFFLRKHQIATARQRLEAEARAAIKHADSNRGFIPHG